MARSTSHARTFVCSCGGPLAPTHQFCPSCGSQVRKACSKCGQVVNDPRHTFCTGCGHRLVSEIPELRRRQAEIDVYIKQCDFKIASIQETSNLYLGYQRQLEASKGSALIADAAMSFIAKASHTHAANAYVQHKNKVDWELLQLANKINQARAEREQQVILWNQLEYQIQEAQLSESRS